MAKRPIPDKIVLPPRILENGEGFRGENDHTEFTSRTPNARHMSPHWQTVKKTAQRKFISTVHRIMSISRKDSWAGTPNDLLVDVPELPIVQLGPVIGKVTHSSARILLEISDSGKVAIVLEKDLGTTGTKNTKTSHPTVEQMLVAGRPGIFVFEHLDPETRYTVKLKGCQKSANQGSSFCTFPSENTPSLNFAVVSCNKIFVTEKEIPSHSDLWAHLGKAIEQRKIDMCLHLGDQIYGDGDKMLDAEVAIPGDWSDCFRKSKEVLANISSHLWEAHEAKVCESYRNVYRKTWSHAPTAYCLANCPNLMIYDDHEVRDNWADLPGDWDSTNVDFFIARCAWKVNLEYQRQLHEDVNFETVESIDKDYHFHLVSGVGIMFLDIRGSRTFHRVPGDKFKYLGSRQWEDIKKALNVGGIFENARVLLVCTPAPLVFLEHKFTNVVANRVQRLEDFKGHWSAAPHFAEQKEMINALWDWKRASTTREVLVLGGDVHCGGHSDIMKDREVAFRQLTTSAIANHPLPKSAYYLLRAAGHLTGVGQSFSFRHHDWTRSRNYGIVKISHIPEDTTIPEVTSQLIKGKFMIGIREGVKVSNLQQSDAGWSCFSRTRK